MKIKFQGMDTRSFLTTQNRQCDATVSHEKIIDWTKSRGGKPAVLKDNNGNASDKLHINFLGFAEDDLQVSWDEFFAIFDRKNLEFLYIDENGDGRESYFYKFALSDSVQ